MVLEVGGSELLEFREFFRAEEGTAARGGALEDVVQEFEVTFAPLFGGEARKLSTGNIW